MRTNQRIAITFLVIFLCSLFYVALIAQDQVFRVSANIPAPADFSEIASVTRLTAVRPNEPPVYELRFAPGKGALTVMLDADLQLDPVLRRAKRVRLTVEIIEDPSLERLVR